ncbi:MAG: hypothetical protein HONBIEJF_02126 [Fimbriimonadaceae bacterium]|nr:hypothetical protein [Fimbriimonadaceae bacterium]
MTAKRWLWVLAAGPMIVGAFQAGQTPNKPKKVDYAHNVAPIFRAHCASCHSGKDASGGLDLTTIAGIKKGGSGKLFVPGKPGQSLLVQRIKGLGGLPQMPMGFKPLDPHQIEAIEQWIAQGADLNAEAKPHWSYQPPKRPSLPTVKQTSWPKNSIDRFVLSRLEKQGLKPSPEADRETLLRRVTLDLTGLPPSPAEIEAYLTDASPRAYERVVDRLLASPQYGERVTRIWLDLSRYADTNGYEADYLRTAWKYRDWLIDAFNRNLPYDIFIRDQMAGDLLPNPTLDQLIATGFHRNSMFNSEGGVDPAEGLNVAIEDRVSTTATVFMGITLMCAKCHDHKYDPFTQKDYYRFVAFFANTDYESRGSADVGQQKFYEPEIDAPSPDQAAKVKELESKLEACRAAINAPDAPVRKGFDAWLATAEESGNDGWSFAEDVKAVSANGATLSVQEDGTILATGENPNTDTYTIEFVARRGASSLRLESIPDPSLVNGGSGRSESGNIILTALRVKVDGKAVEVTDPRATFVQVGYDLAQLKTGNPNGGWALYPEVKQRQELVVGIGEVKPGARIEVKLEFNSPTWAKHTLGKFRLSVTGRKPAMPIPGALRALIGNPNRTAAEREQLFQHFLRQVGSLFPDVAAVKQASDELNASRMAIPKALILRDRKTAGPLQTPVLLRGDFTQKGPMVTAGPPGIFPQPAEPIANRLTLAEWLVSPKNPLTARVQVNRMWEQFFGRGLVLTLDDFGTQGSPPSHPALLDWLATEFIARKWDMKAMAKLIVMSATYRQSSRTSAALRERDPENILLARGPRFRLEAEAIRDVILSASGLLSKKIGGPSVYPSQPEGVWNSPFSGERYMPSEGENRYRRGIYTVWKRTAPYPAFVAFDAISRETCSPRRIRTNTPLQALAMLNDATVTEAGKALAMRMQKEGGTTDRTRLIHGFRLCTGRTPKGAEVKRLLALLSKLQDKAASEAWTLIGVTLLNLDETITRS